MNLKFTFLLSTLFFSTLIFAQEKVKRKHFGIEIVGYYPFQKQLTEKWDYYEVNNVYLLQINGLMNRNFSSKTSLIFGLGFEYLNSSEVDYSLFFPDGVDPSQPDYYQNWIKLSSHNLILTTSGAFKIRVNSKPSHFYFKTGIEGRLGLGYRTSMKWSESMEKLIGSIDLAYGSQVPRLKLAATLALGRHFDFGKFNFFAEAKVIYLSGRLFDNSLGTNFEIMPIGVAVGSFF